MKKRLHAHADNVGIGADPTASERAFSLQQSKRIDVIYANLESQAGLYRQDVYARLKTIFPENSPLHRMANSMLLNESAKLLRASLCVLASDLWGGNRETALHVSLIYELFHTASLIHDDIMDASSQRRNHEALHVKFGTANAIITGDLMLAKGYSLMARFSKDDDITKEQVVQLLEIVGKTGELCCEGQTLDIDMAKNRTYSAIDTYLTMVGLKTGALIEGALKGGAIVGRASQEDLSLIARFGRNLGIAFQIIDDSLDLLGGERASKSVMNDLRQGKATPMLIYALGRASAAERTLLMEAVGDPHITQEGVSAVMAIYRDHQAVEYAQALSHQHIEQAKEALASLPQGAANDRLMAIADVLDFGNLASDER